MDGITTNTLDGLAELSARLRCNATSSVEVVQKILARVERLEPCLQAFSYVDSERALRHASALDKLRSAGVDLGPLMGLPVAVKDLLTIDGMPTRAGSRLELQDLIPPQGSFVRMLLRAGCVLIGKTNTTELALGGYNLSHPLPWNPCDGLIPRMTGGSSHGSAVAMAAGLASFSIGSDTGGSVRWPAALCGVVGYKSSANHWPCDGVFPLSPQMDSLGLFTSSVRDAAFVEAALSDTLQRPRRKIEELTFALPIGHFLENLDSFVSFCFYEAVKRLRNAGATIVEIEVPEAREIDDVFRALVPADLMAFLGRDRFLQQADNLDPVAKARLSAALELTADEYVRLNVRRKNIETLVRERWHGYDAWISPTVPVIPQPVSDFISVSAVAEWNRIATQNTRPANLFNQCGITLPIHQLGSAMPVGLQLCAVAGNDASLLQAACAVEALLGILPKPSWLDDLQDARLIR